MPKQRNVNSHRVTEANKERTAKRVEQYYGKNDLLRTWEIMPDKIQIKHHDDIIKLRARVRNIRNYLLHRADTGADITSPKT